MLTLSRGINMTLAAKAKTEQKLNKQIKANHAQVKSVGRMGHTHMKAEEINTPKSCFTFAVTSTELAYICFRRYCPGEQPAVLRNA